MRRQFRRFLTATPACAAFGFNTSTHRSNDFPESSTPEWKYFSQTDIDMIKTAKNDGTDLFGDSNFDIPGLDTAIKLTMNIDFRETVSLLERLDEIPRKLSELDEEYKRAKEYILKGSQIMKEKYSRYITDLKNMICDKNLLKKEFSENNINELEKEIQNMISFRIKENELYLNAIDLDYFLETLEQNYSAQKNKLLEEMEEIKKKLYCTQ
jgi:hypothetical protein